jgi:hypothetical protein
MAMDAAEVERDAFDRAGLLLARLHAEALPDVLAVVGAAFGDGGYERLWTADSVHGQHSAVSARLTEVTRADAVSYACCLAYEASSLARGTTKAWAVVGITVAEWVGLWLSVEPIVSKKRQPEDDVPTKMATLLLELLKANELPELAIGGAWNGILYCLAGRPSLGPVVLEHGAVELAVEHLRAIGSPADWVSISRGKAGRAYRLLHTTADTCKQFAGEVSRPDLTACVASGLFDLCMEAITAFAASGVDGLQDTHHGALYIMALSMVRVCRAQPGCEGKIRSVADALGFCLMNDLEVALAMGNTTTSLAAQICKNPRAALSGLRLAVHTLHPTGTHLTPSAGLVVQVVAYLAATKVVLISASRQSTSKSCEPTHESNVAVRLELKTLRAVQHAELQANEMVKACPRR